MTEAAGPGAGTDSEPAPAASPALEPVGPELAVRNRRLTAERTGWPDGALEACEKLEAETPGWSISWYAGGGMTWVEAGYYASRADWHTHAKPPQWLYGATVEDLAVAIEEHPLPEPGLAEYRPLWRPDAD